MRIFLGRVVLLAFLSICVGSAAYGQKEYPISAIQGSKNLSPLVGQSVRTSGIVTARTTRGFFLQTPDDKVDSDPNTSEGIYVFTKNEPDAAAAVGTVVSITGQVQEYRPRNEPAGLPLTEISFMAGKDTLQVISKDAALPKPIALTPDSFKNNDLDELEKYEGMRVTAAQMTVVAPTGGRVDNTTNSVVSNGIFYGVVKGLARPFRDPGYDLFDYVTLNEKEKADFAKAHAGIKLFDDNPERLRVETAAQEGSKAIDIPALAELKNVTGVLNYAYRSFSILTDPAPSPAVAGYAPKASLRPATEREFTIAGMNVENFFDDTDDPATKDDVVTREALDKRIKKMSMAVRDVMRMPDIIGTVEVENLSVLKRLADKINSDAVAAGNPDPKYEAYLLEGNDGRGIDVGFLVRSPRIKVIDVKQIGKDEKFSAPGVSLLFDRPPLVMHASITDPKTNTPFEFTVVVNHLKSLRGYDKDDVRRRKQLQAEFLAKWVNDTQKADPKQRIVLVGDFNAYQFSDAIVDVVGTIKGTPAAKDAVLFPSDDLVDPDMTDLVDLISGGQRYSFVFDGNAQTLDHVIVSASMRPYAKGLGFARVNADFPEVFRMDDTRPERYSDHDPIVGYFSFDAAQPDKK